MFGTADEYADGRAHPGKFHDVVYRGYVEVQLAQVFRFEPACFQFDDDEPVGGHVYQ